MAIRKIEIILRIDYNNTLLFDNFGKLRKPSLLEEDHESTFGKFLLDNVKVYDFEPIVLQKH